MTEKVDRIGEIVGFTSSSLVQPEFKKRLELSFHQFQEYLRKLGFQPNGGRVDIDLREKVPGNAAAYYDPDKHLMVIDTKYASSTDLLYREYMHRVLYYSAAAPRSSDTSDWAYPAVESGLATYFPCSLADRPKSDLFGVDSTTYDLNNSRKFTEIKPNIGSAVTEGAEVWGGAFWEIRQLLGKDLADRILFKAWFTLSLEEAQAAPGAGFVRKLQAMDQSLENGKDSAAIQAIFKRRGWPLSIAGTSFGRLLKFHASVRL